MPKFRDIPQLTQAKYHVDLFWGYLEKWIRSHEIDMNPDFQRNYVWTQKQKEQYIEWILRGGNSGREIYFNHPGWFKGFKGTMIIVDGKQRIEAVLGFLHNKIKAYGHYNNEYTDKPDSLFCSFSANVADLESKDQVLKWYLDMNTGGTVHTDEEIKKVKKLIAKENIR